MRRAARNPGGSGLNEAVRRLADCRSKWLLAGAACLSLTLTWVSVTAFPSLPRQNDSVDYFVMADYLAGNGQMPGLFLPPGYPAFLAVTRALGGASWGELMLLYQHLLHLSPLVLFAFLAVLNPGSLLPGLGALVWSAAPEGYVFSHYVMSEIPALALVCLVVCCFIWFWRRPSAVIALAGGLAVGALTLVRPAGPLLAVGGGVILWLHARKGPGRLRSVAFLAGGWFLAVSPWLVHNVMRDGRLSLVDSAGRHLFNRVVAESGLLCEGDPGMKYLEEMRGGEKGLAPTYWWNYQFALSRAGLSEEESDRVMGGVALRAIACEPARYLMGNSTTS